MLPSSRHVNTLSISVSFSQLNESAFVQDQNPLVKELHTNLIKPIPPPQFPFCASASLLRVAFLSALPIRPLLSQATAVVKPAHALYEVIIAVGGRTMSTRGHNFSHSHNSAPIITLKHFGCTLNFSAAFTLVSDLMAE